jgi:DNA-binding winged helix-turn-helix (wHTH) protein
MQTPCTFGDFELDPARRSLTRSSGEAVEIGAKAFDALVCLIEQAGEVITRDTLARALWPTTIVEDNNLSQTIQALRRALGDAGPEHRYVATVPRRGYQFVAPVTALRALGKAPRPRWRGPSALLVAAGISLAVNLICFALLAFWSVHRHDPSRAGTAVAAPAEPAKWPAWRDSRELSTT